MTREDQVLSLLAGANPVPDLSRLEIEPETLAYSEFVEQRSTTMETDRLAVIDPTRPRRRRRGWLMAAAAAAVVVLLAGLGSWALLRQGGDVAGEGEVAGTGEPTVTFDGTTCSYEGPIEFTVGAERNFVYVNASDTRSRLAVGPMPEGASLDDIGSIEFTTPGADLAFITSGAEPGDQRPLIASPAPPEPDRAGEWVVVCQVADANATAATQGGNYGAVVFQVTEG